MSDISPQIPSPYSLNAKDMLRFENEKKSAGVALFLCWMTGLFGGHRFYLGRPHAVTMLVISLVSFPLVFFVIGLLGYLVTWVWMMSDLFKVSG